MPQKTRPGVCVDPEGRGWPKVPDPMRQQILDVCGGKLVHCGIEKHQAKAVEYAILKCRHYLLGHPGFTVVTDHRPLVALLSKPLDEVMNARILRMRERLANFTFNVTWQAGKIHDIADALSRAPVFAARNQKMASPSRQLTWRIRD